MNNRKLEETWKYHNSTKHPGMPPHYLDWANQPIPFKIYTTIDPIEIPADLPPSNVPALTAISTTALDTESECVPDLRTLGRLLFLSAGITKKSSYPGGEIYFRAAACTGALYHIDLYLVTSDTEGLDAGVYHFGPHDFSLRRLRKGDFRSVLVSAAGEVPAISRASVTVICTSTFWRNSWKYQSRAYRHTFWDTGTILANLLAAASAYKVPASIVMGFVDSTVNHLLGLDTNREVVVSLVPLGDTKKPIQSKTDRIETISYETMPLSRREVDYPAIRAMHLASSLTDEEEVRKCGSATTEPTPTETRGELFPLEIHDDEDIGQISNTIEQTILRRGSTRQFARVPITFGQLSNILYRATRGIPADFLGIWGTCLTNRQDMDALTLGLRRPNAPVRRIRGSDQRGRISGNLFPSGSTLNDIYLIANDVRGIPKGSYFYRRDNNALELLKEGDFRDKAGHLGLGQDIPADASVDVFFLVDLNRVLEKFGNRGYRAAELEAGIIGGRLYLGAYGQGLGASGLTFFDDDVTRFFSPHAEGKSVMFLVALGKSVRKRSE